MGVEIDWFLDIVIPSHPKMYRFSLQSKPAEQFNVRGRKTDKVYEAMALSAYADFCREFIKQSGLEHTLKNLIALKEEDGKKRLVLNLSKEWFSQALSEFAESEEGAIDLKEIAQEYVHLFSEVSSYFVDTNISGSFDYGGFDLDISFD